MIEELPPVPSEPSPLERLSDIYPQKNVEDDYERVLGKLAMRFSLLHFFLEWYCWTMCGIDHDTGHALTKDLPISHLAEKMTLLLESKIAEEKNRRALKAILEKVRKAATKRNELLHALWFIQEGKPVFYLRRRSGLPDSPAPSIEEIKRFNLEIGELIVEFLDFKDQSPHMKPFGLGLQGLFELGRTPPKQDRPA